MQQALKRASDSWLDATIDKCLTKGNCLWSYIDLTATGDLSFTDKTTQYESVWVRDLYKEKLRRLAEQLNETEQRRTAAMHSNDPNHPQCGVEHTYIEAPVIGDNCNLIIKLIEACEELYEATRIAIDPDYICLLKKEYLQDFIAELATKGATQLGIIDQCFLEAFMGNEDEDPSLSRLQEACLNRAIADNWPCPSTQADAAYLLQEARKNDGN
jgi:hypothetical protein